MFRRLLVICALGLMVPASAHAASQGWEAERALLVAGVVWHHPCADKVSIQFSTADDSVAWTTPGVCVVYVTPDTPRPWEEYCTIIIHEVGHLAGQEHSSNPNSVMYPVQGFAEIVTPAGVRYVGTDPRCRDRGRPYLEAHGVLSPRRPLASRSRIARNCRQGRGRIRTTHGTRRR